MATSSIGDENPDWGQEKLFLKVLLEGKAKLYCYDGRNGRKFFYSVNDTPINQLVYKRFIISSSIAENNSYKDQLLMDLNCPNSGLPGLENITYTAEDLVEYFKAFNTCMGDMTIEMNK